MPPNGPEKNEFATFVFQGAIFGVFTLVGLIGFLGRFYDGILDALIANWSDRRFSENKKRRLPMGLAALPLAVFAALVFFPLKPEVSAANGWWLLVSMLVYYLFFSLYTVPYTALMAELGHDPKDRMRISTFLSVAWAVGFLLGSNVYLFQDLLEKRGFSPVSAFQWTVCGFSAIALVAMLVPVFFLNEKKYALQSASAPDLRESISTVSGNRNFRWFVAADFMYWIALTFIQTGVIYYVTLLMGFEKTQATEFLTIAAVGSFLLYPAVIWLASRFGKKRLVMISFGAFSAIFTLVSMVGWLPVSPDFLFYCLALVASFPLSALGIIPMAIISDIVFEEEKTSGQQLSGMFFAARAFTMKVGISLANLIFPSLLLLGKSEDNSFGVRASAVLAAVFCVLGMVFFSELPRGMSIFFQKK